MIDPEDKAYQTWKSFFGIAQLVQDEYGHQLSYLNQHGQKVEVDNIALKDFGQAHYLSWTEAIGETMKLLILELQPHRNRQLEWTIAPAERKPMFWTSKWSPIGLHAVYHDQQTNFALRVQINKQPSSLKLEVQELAPKICILENWQIAFQGYTEAYARLFDLKTFQTPEAAVPPQIQTCEQGEYHQELQDWI